MIRAAHIARFRGLRDCIVDGFGRVNLIIGRNNCGKTAFMEALRLAEDAQDAAHYLLRDQRIRLGRGVKRHDFERYWQPIFFDLDAKAGLSISTIRDDGVGKRLEVRQGAVSEEIIQMNVMAEALAMTTSMKMRFSESRPPGRSISRSPPGRKG